MKSNKHLQVSVFSCFSCHFQSFMPPSCEHAVLSSGCGVLHVLLCCKQSPCCHTSTSASPRLLLHLLHAEMSPSKSLQLLCMLSQQAPKTDRVQKDALHVQSELAVLISCNAPQHCHANEVTCLLLLAEEGKDAELNEAARLVDASVIDLDSIEVCKQSNGEDWLLGMGSFGMVSTSLCVVPAPGPMLCICNALARSTDSAQPHN